PRHGPGRNRRRGHRRPARSAAHERTAGPGPAHPHRPHLRKGTAMKPTYVLGIDSSTQSCKALLVDAQSGEVVAEQRSSHLPGTQIDPQHWVTALETATTGLLEQASAVSIAGQQHGMVALDE